ncbi:MAG: hypothetical protein AAF587_11480 [Bacteroidota bacterium]
MEQTQHLTTFQNLCVIAFSDGELDKEEIFFLEELADSMGLAEKDIQPLLANGPTLEFVIPETEQDRYMELRMVVLMMLADGKMRISEYKACKRLASLMGIEDLYLDEVIDVYQNKRQEQLRHLGIFQNLYLIAAADGVIEEVEQQFLLDVAHKLGLTQWDIDSVIKKYPNLDFVIPEDKDEGWYSLKNLVYMMVVDGSIENTEYGLCVEFAQRIGEGAEAVEKILEEYEALQEEREAQQSEIERANIDIYLDIYLGLKNLPLTTAELFDALVHVIHSGEVDMEVGTEQETRTFYEFLWLACVRLPNLNREAEHTLPIYLDLARAGNNFQPLLDYILQIEQQHGANLIQIHDISLEQIHADLRSALEVEFI